MHAYRLRGYIFFGSVCPLVDHLRGSLGGALRPACLMLDFAAVSGFDFSAVSVLCRLLQSANSLGVRVVLSALPEPLRIGMERNLPPAEFSKLLIEPNLDRALERGEDLVIAAWKADVDASNERRSALLEHAADDLERHLERQIRFEDLAEELGPWTTSHDYMASEALAGPDVRDDGLQLLLSGRASAYDSAGARLHQCSPGDAIWPADPASGEAGAVIADEPCHTMVLAPAARRWLEEHEERLALKLYRYLLAGRFPAEPRGGG